MIDPSGCGVTSRRAVLGTLGIGGLVLARPSLASVTAQARDFRTARAAIDASLTDGVPSVSAAVSQGSALIWQEAFGLADRETGRAATPATPYLLASITKPIVATAIMQLVHDGAIELDQPVNTLLSSTLLTSRAADADRVTIRHLLSHTGGLPYHHEFFAAGATNQRSFRDTIARYGIVVFPPGDVHRYSNLNYGILGQVIENVSRQPLHDHLARNLFAPLQMRESWLGLAESTASPPAALYSGIGSRIEPYDVDHRGASLGYASARDLLRFGMFHLGALRTAPNSFRHSILRMQQNAAPSASSQQYGLGWELRRDARGRQIVSHNGGMPGTGAVIDLYPEREVAIVVLTNRSPRGVARRVADAIAHDLFGDAPANDGPARARASPAGLPFAIPATLYGDWTGDLVTYTGNHRALITFHRDGDIHLKLGRGLTSLVNFPSLEGGLFSGSASATIPTPDASRNPHEVWLTLQVTPDKLRGQAVAQESSGAYSLASYLELTRTIPALRSE